ncbi:hypothetical protein VOLCADRAFT_99858 [Volvox carteri f. nagariensis]|uniref:Syntaxin N-terminal domain-containing protein n=1 Tax=Volvox carteri f. nagariensis TaxID=3068 RepID=D8UIT9_VOLCA|nr:uncharacterized protein VOLCADRAFT_99858 [Volvox carteri f. nagariensis]EFJ40366.1 hypothetical protein VOLCADRAFT_99858 [Volvox carteri f. nagariensis]|eukprot:XP_002958570.1 hypothetical protein VOLCADRAFT_99858 [Volvox carteri f. nagariensis]
MVDLTGPITSSSVAPSWVQQSNGIQQKLKVLKKLIAELKKYHDEALLVTFNRNSGAQDAEMLTLEVQQRFKQLHAEIRTTGPNNDAEIQKRVQQQLAQALFKLSLEFRREEMRFLNKVEEQMGMERGSSIGLIEEEEGTW